MSLNLSARSERAKQTRRGLTLIELIVVLVILVGLGSLLIPAINNGLERAHLATCSTNIPEITNMFGRLVTTGGDIGDNFDSGIVAAGTTVGINGQNVEALATGEGTALNALGISTLVDHSATTTGDYNVTFNPYDATPVTRTVEDGASVITLTTAQEESLSLDTDGKYIWLGLGPNWSGMRDQMYECPVHFGDTDGALPHQVYSRFGVVIQVADAGGALERAEFRGVSYSLDGDAYETAENHIALHWQEVVAN